MAWDGRKDGDTDRDKSRERIIITTTIKRKLAEAEEEDLCTDAVMALIYDDVPSAARDWLPQHSWRNSKRMQSGRLTHD